MANKLSLENITTLLEAADKIRNAVNPQSREEGSLSISADNLSKIRSTMDIISGFLPESSRVNFNNAVKSCDRYSSGYCSLKKHIRDLKGQDPDVNHILSTLKVVMPMLENQQAVPLRKAVSILEAIKE